MGAGIVVFAAATVATIVVVVARHRPAASQVVLPFAGPHYPFGVAVDAAGDLYAADQLNNRVVKLAAGATAQTVLPFSVSLPKGVAVDAAGSVYVTDDQSRVLKLAAGSTAQTVLPFTGLSYPDGVAVDGGRQPVRRRPGQQPGGETLGGLDRADRADRAAVCRPEPAQWRGG